MDASAIMQNDAAVENMKAMTLFTRDYGVYSKTPSDAPPPPPPENRPPAPVWPQGSVPAGACLAWEEKLKEIPAISGDAGLSGTSFSAFG
jgi:hypothetical protein